MKNSAHQINHYSLKVVSSFFLIRLSDKLFSKFLTTYQPLNINKPGQATNLKATVNFSRILPDQNS